MIKAYLLDRDGALWREMEVHDNMPPMIRMPIMPEIDVYFEQGALSRETVKVREFRCDPHVNVQSGGVVYREC